MDFLSADGLPWLHGAQSRLREAQSAGRLPHSLLLLAPPGLGVEALAYWIMAFALCEGPALRPCGACASCQLLRADSHPDALVLRVEEDAKQIKIEQVRGLIESLTLKSYRGGYKVALIEGAELLNANGANAFLKTLEEPTQNTLLILSATPSHRLPATIASRCLRLTLRAPARADALAWLAGRGSAGADWGGALQLAGGAPLLALEIEAAGLARLDADMHRDIDALARGAADASLVAEAWIRSGLPLRLAWLENWLTQRIRSGLVPPEISPNETRVGLPDRRLRPKICQLFDLHDAVRSFRRLGSSSMNQQLALEAMLLGGLKALS
jgi:DNA polymerase-3 subunit delta'